MNSSVFAMTVFNGELVAAGYFTTAGGVDANRIAKWDGSTWSPLGSGMNSEIYALAVFDDDGAGPNPPALYAGGSFTTAGGVNANRIARWNGTSWSPVSGGVNGGIRAMTVFDDGFGPALYVGGYFTLAGAVAATNIARWNGNTWAPLALGLGEDGYQVTALAVFDDGAGSGPALYAGGSFTTAGYIVANGVAKWNGKSWSPLGSGIGANNGVSAMAVYDDGGGPALFVGGAFQTAGGVFAYCIAKWDGTNWAPLPGGSVSNYGVNALCTFDDGTGPALFVGGSFAAVGGLPVNYVVKWNGFGWTSLDTGVNSGVSALTAFDDGALGGRALYVGGGFYIIGQAVVNRIAKWVAAGAPLVLQHPSNQTAQAGQAVALTVTATGGLLTYQWRKDGQALSNGGSISGATTSALTINPVALADAGQYDVLVTNPCGSVLSNAATLTVIQPCLADINQSGAVDVTDLLLIIALWGPCPGLPNLCANGDIAPPGGDGVVNVNDLLAVINGWGPCP